MKAPRFLYHEVGRDQATHYIYRSVSGRTLLVPTLGNDVNKSLAFFGVGQVDRFINRLLRLVRRVSYVLVDLSDINLRNQHLSDCVFYVGTVGPYQKYTVYCRSRVDDTATVTKLSLTDAALHLIKNEAEVLGQLAILSPLRGSVPRLISYGVSDGLAWVTQVAGDGEPAKRSDYQAAMDFLLVLRRATGSIAEYSESLCRSSLLSRVAKLKPLLSNDWQLRCDRASNFLDLHATQPMCIVRAHRDFTRWNIKIKAGKPFVYDWEYSAVGYPSSYDPLHFLLLPLAAKNCLNNSEIKSTFKKITQTCGLPNDSSVNWHALFYMFDLCMFYLESNAGRDDGDVVVKCYSRIIDNIVTGKF